MWKVSEWRLHEVGHLWKLARLILYKEEHLWILKFNSYTKWEIWEILWFELKAIRIRDLKNFASFKTIRCKLKPIRSWTFVRICRLKPNKRKILRSTISLTAFGFCRCHCGGGIPDYFQYFPCALRGIASRAIRSQLSG